MAHRIRLLLERACLVAASAFFILILPLRSASVSAQMVMAGGDTGTQADNPSDNALSYSSVAPRIALEEAVRRNNLGEAKQLLESGADPNRRGGYQRTSLHYAARLGNEHIVVLLLSYGANPNLQDEHGFTPLHRGVQSKHLKVITALLEAGANPELKTKVGEDSLAFCEPLVDEEIAKLVRSYMN